MHSLEQLRSGALAGTLLPVNQPLQSRALEALEVRAFGCLLDELLAHAQPEAGQAGGRDGITAMAEMARQLNPA